MAWALSVRTTLFVAGQYLRRASIASDTPLFSTDHYSRLSNSMAQAPFVTAFNIDSALMQQQTGVQLQLLGDQRLVTYGRLATKNACEMT